MPSCGVCLSVCLCVVNSVKTNKHIFNIFSPSGKPSRSIFLIIKRYSNIPTGIPLGVDAGGVGRNCDSEPISGFPAYGKSYAVKRSSGQCSKLSCDEPCRVYWLVAWHSTVGRTSVFDQRTFPVLRSTCS